MQEALLLEYFYTAGDASLLSLFPFQFYIFLTIITRDFHVSSERNIKIMGLNKCAPCHLAG
jgi:hypothetical protein